MGNIAYGLWSENRAYRTPSGGSPTVTVVTGALDAAFPVANVNNLNPGQPVSVVTAPCRIQWDMGSAVSIEAVALIHHNLDVGLGVKIEADPSGSWGVPAMSQLFTFTADFADGYSKNPIKDIRGVSHSYRYWSLLIPSGNSATPYIGEVWMFGTLRELEVNPNWGLGYGRQQPGIRHMTKRGTRIDYAPGSKMRTLTAALIDTTDVGRTSLETLADDTLNGARPFVIVPDGVTGTDAWMVKLAAFPDDYVVQSNFIDRNVAPFAVVEVSRGLTVIA